MTFVERIQNELTQAMKTKDELRLSTLRMMKSAMKLKEVEKMRPLDDAEALQIMQTLVKQRRESVELFTKGNRMDLADKETEGNRDHRRLSARRAERRGYFRRH